MDDPAVSDGLTLHDIPALRKLVAMADEMVEQADEIADRKPYEAEMQRFAFTVMSQFVARITDLTLEQYR